MIKLEGRTKNPPTMAILLRTVTEAATKAASSEVLGSHKGLKAKELSEYMSTYFKRTWDHYDVTKSGELGVETMPAFMRFLSSDQTLNL